MQMQQQPPLSSSNNVAAKESTLHGQKEASMVAAAWTAGFHRRVDKNKTGKEEGNVKEGSSSILVIAEKGKVIQNWECKIFFSGILFCSWKD